MKMLMPSHAKGSSQPDLRSACSPLSGGKPIDAIHSPIVQPAQAVMSSSINRGAGCDDGQFGTLDARAQHRRDGAPHQPRSAEEIAASFGCATGRAIVIDFMTWRSTAIRGLSGGSKRP